MNIEKNSTIATLTRATTTTREMMSGMACQLTTPIMMDKAILRANIRVRIGTTSTLAKIMVITTITATMRWMETTAVAIMSSMMVEKTTGKIGTTEDPS